MSVQKPPFFHLFMATGFGSGFSPVAPGTAGALLAVLLWMAGYFLLPFEILQTVLAVAIVYFTVQGIYSSAVMENTGVKIRLVSSSMRWWVCGFLCLSFRTEAGGMSSLLLPFSVFSI